MRVCWVSFGAWLLGQCNYDASGLLKIRRCCALRLVGKSQTIIIPICVSLEGCIMPCCKSLHDSIHLFVLAGIPPGYLVQSL